MCVYWPNINDAIKQLDKECSICNKYSQVNQREPLLPHSVPSRPWEKIGADYFTIATQNYLLVVDYFSKYPEIVPVKSKSADITVQVMKTISPDTGSLLLLWLITCHSTANILSSLPRNGISMLPHPVPIFLSQMGLLSAMYKL